MKTGARERVGRIFRLVGRCTAARGAALLDVARESRTRGGRGRREWACRGDGGAAAAGAGISPRRGPGVVRPGRALNRFFTCGSGTIVTSCDGRIGMLKPY